MKRYRDLPAHAIRRDGRNVFGRLGAVEIRDYAVSLTRHLLHDANAPRYSDADLELLIARLKVAREVIVANIDENIAILTEILNAKEAAPCPPR